MGEFELIRKFFLRPARSVVLGNGDDCALIDARSGMVLAVSTDMLVAGRHFFEDANPHAVGWKSLAVNLSDLAAMAARPRAFTLALALPEANQAWIEQFAAGLFECAEAFCCELVGGDTTRGPLTISITVFGDVVAELAPKRAGGQIGDQIWVSGELGSAAYALALEQRRRQHALPEATVSDMPADLKRRLDYPQPRLELGQALGSLAHAMIDVSDGLLGDLGHILVASGCGAVVEESRLPRHRLLNHLGGAERRQYLLGGGDDYELCFTCAPDQQARIEAIGSRLSIPVTCIGELTKRAGIELIGENGERMVGDEAVLVTGFDHFA
jgi:thiamine-monophosphate kinase